MITTQIEPNPQEEIRTELNFESGKMLVILLISKGTRNICVSDTTVRPRKDIYLFDYDAVNEVVLNALVHNDWTVAEPQISLFCDRMEILSHGGLPKGMTREDFTKVSAVQEM